MAYKQSRHDKSSQLNKYQYSYSKFVRSHRPFFTIRTIRMIRKKDEQNARPVSENERTTTQNCCRWLDNAHICTVIEQDNMPRPILRTKSLSKLFQEYPSSCLPCHFYSWFVFEAPVVQPEPALMGTIPFFTILSESGLDSIVAVTLHLPHMERSKWFCLTVLHSQLVKMFEKLACNMSCTSISSRDGLYWPSPERLSSPPLLISIAFPPDQQYLACWW